MLKRHWVLSSAWIFAVLLCLKAHGLSSKDVQLLTNELGALKTSPQNAIAAAGKLQQFHYLDVAEALIERLHDEISKDPGAKINTFVVNALLNSLQAMGRRNVSYRLRQLRTELHDRLEREANTKTLDIVLDEFDRTVEAMDARPGALRPSPLLSGASNNGALARLQRWTRRRLVRVGFKPQPPATTPAARQDRPTPVEQSPYPTSRELLERAVDIPKDEKATLTKFLDSLERNCFDRSIEQQRSGQFVEYKGRLYELRRLYQAFLRTEKGHAFVTGKAAVGKTTLMQMLSDAYVQNLVPYPGKAPPLVEQLSLLDVTNPTDPTRIEAQIKLANRLATRLDRHIILFVDEAHVATSLTRNALKSFLTRMLDASDNQVHLAWLTTSSEGKEAKEDTAFSRRWVDVFVPEWNYRESVEAIEKAHLPHWKKVHALKTSGGVDVKIDSIDERAYEMAQRYAPLENPYAALLSGMKELLEGAMIHKLDTLARSMREDPSKVPPRQNLTLEPLDVREYLKFHLGRELVPGDANFKTIFEKLWQEFDANTKGNDGMKMLMKPALASFLGSVHHTQMEAWMIPGPPGAGKTYLVKELARVFFNDAILDLRGSNYREGGFQINNLIGSGPGVKDSEARKAQLTDFFSTHKSGIIFVDEADAMHLDIYEFFSSMITDGKMTDGMNKNWPTMNYILIGATNVGQEHMLPPNRRNRLTWEQYDMRRSSITHVVNGVDVVRPEILEEVFEQLFHRIVRRSRPHDDGSQVQLEALKQMRRWQTFYMLTPNAEEILAATQSTLNRYVERAHREFEVQLDLSALDPKSLIEIDKYDFFLGYTYIQNQLQRRLFNYLAPLLSERGAEVKVTMAPGQLRLSRDGVDQVEDLLPMVERSKNPWANSRAITQRIHDFTSLMQAELPDQQKQIAHMQSLLDIKLHDWDQMVVLSQIGSSEADLSALGHKTAEIIFGDKDAAYAISGLHHVYDLSDHIRPPRGTVNSTETTDFEEWFKSRQRAGGGVILLEGILDVKDLNDLARTERINIFNKIRRLLTQGQMAMAGRSEDARGFVVILTGNAMAEVFETLPHSPFSEGLYSHLLSKISLMDTYKYIQQALNGTIAGSIGPIFLNPPPTATSLIAKAQADCERMIEESNRDRDRPIHVDIDLDVYQHIYDRASREPAVSQQMHYEMKRQVVTPLLRLLAVHGNALQRVRAFWSDDNHVSWLGNGELLPKFAAEPAPPPPPPKINAQELRWVGIHETKGHYAAQVLLTRQQSAMGISVAATGEAFVLSELDSPVQRLTTYLKSMIMLEAGHRAVIQIAGVHASGGGAPHTNKGPVRDDLGRANEIIDLILANQLLTHYSDFDDRRVTQTFRQTLRLITKFAADHVVRLAHQSGQFDDLLEQVLREGYVDRAGLEKHLHKMDWSAFPDPDALLLEAVEAGIQEGVDVGGSEVADALLRTLKKELRAGGCEKSLRPAGEHQL